MKVHLKNVRLSFPDLFKAVEFKPGDGKPRYNATFLIVPDSDNDKAIRAAIVAAAEESWGDKAKKIVESIKGQSNKFCYLDGDLKDYEGYADHLYLACHSKTRPTVVDGARQPLTQDDGKPYAGCYVNAIVDIWAQKGENQGMRASFSGVQFASDGEAFSASAPASADEFEELAGATADDFA